MTKHKNIASSVLKLYISFVTLALGLALSARAALAQDPSAFLWQASYWNNTSLAGAPVLRRDESSINYNWGTGSPAPEVNKDSFSARWTGDIAFSRGTYRFTASSDDGLRVWVDGDLIIDAWSDHLIKTFTADKALSEGRHHIVVEYYEHVSGAIVRLEWAPAPPADGQFWQGEYFNNTSLSGDPALVRRDADIAFNWTTSSPAPGVQADKFSVRWRRTVNLPAGTYRFAMTVDDGGRLWVNGHFEAFKDQPEAATIVDVVPPFVVPRIWLPFVAKE